METDAVEGDRGRVLPPIVNKLLNAAPAVMDGREGDVVSHVALFSARVDDTTGPAGTVKVFRAAVRAAACERVNEDVGDDVDPSAAELDCAGLNALDGRAAVGLRGVGDSTMCNGETSVDENPCARIDRMTSRSPRGSPPPAEVIPRPARTDLMYTRLDVTL